MPSFLLYLSVFAACAIACAAATYALVRKQISFGQDQPDLVRKNHDAPIPRGGGRPIFTTFVVGFAVLVATDMVDWQRWWPLILCNTLIFVLGFVDDLRPLGAKIKLLGQIGASLIAFSLGLSIDVLSNPLGEGSFDLQALSLPLTLFWCVAITNIVNLIDGMDGLASGLGLFLSLCLAAVGYLGGEPAIAFLGLLMGGSLLGFLFFNFPPARIFLGDGGAYFLGFFIATLSMQTSHKGTVAAALLVVMIALGLPILDTLFAILRRGIRGMPLFRADAEHIHHKLLLMGYSKHVALLVLYGVILVLCGIGISVFLSKGLTLPIAGTAIVTLALVAARLLGYIHGWGQLKGQMKNALSRRKEVRYAILHERVLEHDLERCKDAESFWKRFDDTMLILGFSRGPRPGFDKVHFTYSQKTKEWVLYSKEGERSERDTRSILECMLPIYLRAIDYWSEHEQALTEGEAKPVNGVDLPTEPG